MNTVAEINQALCESARIIAEKVVENSRFDKTIKATIITGNTLNIP